MAGSKNKNQTTNKKNSNQRSNRNTTSAKKNVKQTKANVQQQETDSLGTEIAVWIIAAIMLLLELGNFGICGFVNYISQFCFGLFGVIEYVLPIIVMITVFFLHVNEYKSRAIHKVVFASLVLLCLGMIAQLNVGIDDYNFVRIFKEGFSDKTGGGIICGSLAYLLHAAVGKVGTYIIIILAAIICVVLFTEMSIIDFLKEIFSNIMSMNDGKEQDDEMYIEEFDEIVTEDFSKQRKGKKTETKQLSILDNISVLPADTDQGILPTQQVQSITLSEDVHEITMDYEIPLPGENMNDIVISEVDKETVKETAKKTVKRERNRTKVTPAVLPIEEKTDLTNMENKTVAEVKNVSAKEIGKSDSQYRFPPLELLQRGKNKTATREDSIRQNALKLQEVLKSFGVNVTMTNYSCGPSVTRYEMVPEQGVKVSKITGLADDIMMNLAAQSIRIEAPIPGKSAVGIEIPNGDRSGVGFRELIDTEKFIKHPSKIAFAVGKDIEGNVVVEDIAKMPHLLIAGATGSGKSVCTNTLIMSILYKAKPDEVKLILIDPKQVELKVYNGIPHLLTPVVTDPKKAAGALNWAVAEMTKRYQMFSECNVRNIQGYNSKVKELEESGAIEEEKLEKMPQIVIIVDELADLMMVAKAEVEEAIVRLAQLARAAGIHLVIATQRPSVDVVTGLIKANVPSRIALSVSSGVDSRTIIDSTGAEKLLGNGDMLFYPTMYPKPVRVQGAYISDEEVLNVVEYLKVQNGESQYSEEVTKQISTSGTSTTVTIGDGGAANDRDEYFVQAGKFIIEKDKASIGMLQRMFKVGFNRAARIMDQLFEAGVVGPEEGTKPRQVLMTEEEFDAYIDEYF